jgi:transglutaminase-like putative cysteine protease
MKTFLTNKSILYTTLLYLCGLLLFLEWLYPVEEIAETSNLSMFIFFAFFCFLISLFQMKWWITFLIKGIGLLFIINRLFFEQSFFSLQWLDAFYEEFTYNMGILFSQQWYYITPIFRSVLFLILIWLISYLLHYWFVIMKRILLFILLTFVYITVLDTFTTYDASLAIVRVFVISFVALGIANFMRTLDNAKVSFGWLRKTPVWFLPLLGIVLLSTVIGFLGPKMEPQWPDPVPFIQSATGTGNGAGGPVQKVGYGEDDSRLGGSFKQDDTPVFQVTDEEEHYWRIETKDIYTGKGWEPFTEPDYHLQEDGIIDLETFSDTVDTERHEATLQFQGNTSIEKLIYPYGIHQAIDRDASYYLDDQSGAVQTREDNKVTDLDQYSIVYDLPSFQTDQLRKVDGGKLTDYETFYTQLPPALPERIGELAVDITSSYNNRYDQAKAIERYFGQNEFEYQTEDIPVPGRQEDYVDQFLFDSKVGYCDNFSTSMVVMLRTLDIPARWAKGFTSGQMMTDQKADMDVSGSGGMYEVTNANAHSWVEVFFPDVGWVPFEPTQGFSNLTDFHSDTGDTNQVKDQDDDHTDNTPEQAEQKEEKEQDTAEKEQENKTKTAHAKDESNTTSFNIWYIAVITLLLAIIGFTIYKTRFRWQTLLLARKLKNRNDAKTYQEAYHHLLNILDHHGFKKAADQTLREFASTIDAHYQTDEMRQLTTHFEHVLYSNKVNEAEMDKLTKLWKDLIKRVMG